MKYDLAVTFTEPLLASSPSDPKVYDQFIASRQRKEDEDRGDEVATLPAAEQERVGASVFHRDDSGLFLFDYHLRGFFKDSAEAVIGRAELSAYKSKINKWLFVSPRRIRLLSANGAAALAPDGDLQRPLRAMTMQGPRVSVKRSEKLDAGARFIAQIEVLPLGEKELSEERLRKCLDYGAYAGLGEWRNGSFGRFEYILTAK